MGSSHPPSAEDRFRPLSFLVGRKRDSTFAVRCGRANYLDEETSCDSTCRALKADPCCIELSLEASSAGGTHDGITDTDSQLQGQEIPMNRAETRLKAALCLLSLSLCFTASSLFRPESTHAASLETLRVRELIVVDDAGKERIVIGAPIPNQLWMEERPSAGFS